jgi:hypothetical protein
MTSGMVFDGCAQGVIAAFFRRVPRVLRLGLYLLKLSPEAFYFVFQLPYPVPVAECPGNDRV